jgi:hypothetical protein
MGGSITDDIESLITIADCDGNAYQTVRSTTVLEDFEAINREDDFNILA